MLVSDCLREISEVDANCHVRGNFVDREVTGVTNDSRAINVGSVFVAVKGSSQDGHEFVGEVVRSGAVLCVGERELDFPNYVRVGDSKKVLARLAGWFYGNPSHSMLLIGVTGTSGKTTSTYLLESILKAEGHKVGVIGTIEVRYGDVRIPAELTTPSAVRVQEILALMKKEGCTAVVMEVSSHALKQERVASVAFDRVVFTNLTPEHLDFHENMQDYFAAKSKLFSESMDYSRNVGKEPVAIINEGDVWGKRLRGEWGGLAFEEAEVQVTADGVRGLIGGVPIKSSLTGSFNATNIAGAVTVAKSLGISKIAEGVEALKGVPGRLERVHNQSGIFVWVDYAHKPDALEKVIHSLKQMKAGGNLITVFGCGGDRDKTKRPRMGKIAVEDSDFVIVTSDNPRTEDPKSIIGDILKGIEKKNFAVEPDRKKAIFQAVQMAKRGDLVLVAGKGHEDYQILGRQKIHFDDREVVREALDTSF